MNFSVFDRKELSFEIQISLSTHEQPQIEKPTDSSTATSNYRGVEENGDSRPQQQTDHAGSVAWYYAPAATACCCK